MVGRDGVAEYFYDTRGAERRITIWTARVLEEANAILRPSGDSQRLNSAAVLFRTGSRTKSKGGGPDRKMSVQGDSRSEVIAQISELRTRSYTPSITG